MPSCECMCLYERASERANGCSVVCRRSLFTNAVSVDDEIRCVWLIFTYIDCVRHSLIASRRICVRHVRMQATILYDVCLPNHLSPIQLCVQTHIIGNYSSDHADGSTIGRSSFVSCAPKSNRTRTHPHSRIRTGWSLMHRFMTLIFLSYKSVLLCRLRSVRPNPNRISYDFFFTISKNSRAIDNVDNKNEKRKIHCSRLWEPWCSPFELHCFCCSARPIDEHASFW